ncbi:hypothetical protein QE357_004483 [Siphonobacter sp. BAB-5404]|nr:hypothetical protein [Siphonobacter sp. SORGH_AS_1065]MDR6197371.1 hypothetical protein [Siphonobacter sp. SORGH_AS_0500]
MIYEWNLGLRYNGFKAFGTDIFKNTIFFALLYSL